MKKIKCPYRLGQYVFASFITREMKLAKITAINEREQKIKIRTRDCDSSVRYYGDRMRTLTDEEEMLVMLENA